MVLSLIRWYNRNRTTKCLKRLQKRSIEYDNLRQLVLIRQDHVLVNLSTCFFRSDSDFFFTFPKKWVGRAIGNETLIYGDGHMVQFMLRVSSRQTIFCLVTNEPRSLSTLIYVIPIGIWVGNAINNNMILHTGSVLRGKKAFEGLVSYLSISCWKAGTRHEVARQWKSRKHHEFIHSNNHSSHFCWVSHFVIYLFNEKRYHPLFSSNVLIGHTSFWGGPVPEVPL